jgi:hypothetical protein
MSRLAPSAWTAEALARSLRLALLLGQWEPANDNGEDVVRRPALGQRLRESARRPAT